MTPLGRFGGRGRGRLAYGLLAVVVLVLLAVAAYFWARLAGGIAPALGEISLAPAAFVELLRGWGAWAVAGSIGLMVLHSFVPFPAECLAVANGMVFGFFWGSVITWTGAMLGAFLAFGLARRLGQPFVRRALPERHWGRIEGWSGAHGWSTLLTARLVPVIAFNLINYAAGLTTVSWWTFTWTTGLGILPLTLLMVLLGERMLDVPPWTWLLLLVVAVAAWWLLQRLVRHPVALPRGGSAAPGDRG